MNDRGKKCGFTLIEMLLVIAIIILLVGMVIGVTKHFDDQGKEQLCRNEFALIDSALEQFRDFGFNYKDANFAGLAFPLDCNDMDLINANPFLNLQGTLNYSLYNTLPPTTIAVVPVSPTRGYNVAYSGSAALYFILNQVPDCRTTLSKIDKSLLTNRDEDKVTDMNFVITTPTLSARIPFTRIIDPWKKTLRYDYYPDFNNYAGTLANYVIDRNNAKRTFPIVTSAGPDKMFDTADDIINRKPE